MKQRTPHTVSTTRSSNCAEQRTDLRTVSRVPAILTFHCKTDMLGILVTGDGLSGLHQIFRVLQLNPSSPPVRNYMQPFTPTSQAIRPQTANIALHLRVWGTSCAQFGVGNISDRMKHHAHQLNFCTLRPSTTSPEWPIRPVAIHPVLHSICVCSPPARSRGGHVKQCNQCQRCRCRPHWSSRLHPAPHSNPCHWKAGVLSERHIPFQRYTPGSLRWGDI